MKTRSQRGFAAIVAIAALVILAVFAAAIVAFGSRQQLTSAQDTMSSRAWQAARAGNEWGLYRALKQSACNAAGDTLDLVTDTGFYVTVRCYTHAFNEGESTPGVPRPVTFYQIQAVACPVNGCPSADGNVVRGLGYVERTRIVLVQ